MIPSNALEPGSTTSSELFERLISGVRDYAIYLLSPSGTVISWNAGAQRIKGFAPEEIIGQQFSRFYTEEDRAACVPERALQTALLEGKFEAEGWRVRKDGTRFWAHVVLDALYDDAGNPIGLAKVTRDITAQRSAREAMERERANAFNDKSRQYRDLLRLFEQAPGFVCFFRGPDHVYELQNAAHHRLAEFKDIIGKPVREALPELKGQGFFELLDRVFETGKPYLGHALPLIVNSDKDLPTERRYIDFIYQPIFDDDGKVLGIFSQGNDVTEQVQVQEVLERKQEELEQLILDRTEALESTSEALKLVRELQGDKTHLLQLLGQAPGFVCVLRGEDHTFELANAAYRGLVGNRDVIGKPVRDALPEMVDQGIIELLDGVYRSGEPFLGKALPVDIEPRAGSAPVTHYLDFIYQPITGDDGQVIGIFVQGNDVTAQKQAQDEIKRYQNNLEELVQQRTIALADAQAALQRSQKLEAIGKLTGGIAHDFNNILQVIGGNLQLLSTCVGRNEVAVTRIENAANAVDRGSRLSAQLLAFARRQPLQPAVTNLGRIITAMDDMLGRVLGEMIDIESVTAGGLWNTLVDPSQLENVVLNLVINARDAMPDGGKLTIELSNAMLDDEYVSSEVEVTAGQYVMLAISDTGIGMTREVMERACDPFFTTKPEGVGTGLGLSMAYGFVKQSGGHFKIYSELGHGTTIKIYLPRSYEAMTEPLPTAPVDVVGGNETILVVEDDLAVQATVVEMLRELGYKVLKADNAEAALGILQSGLPIDLLFTDVVMPGRLRSPELARQAQSLLPGIAVLYTSGYTQNAIVHGGRLDPGVHLLTKPYRREQLARKVRHLLANKQQSAMTPPTHTGDALEAMSPRLKKRRILVVEDHPELRHMACELVKVLGHEADGASSAEQAGELFSQFPFDTLLSDVSLPGMNGIELARKLRRQDPALKVIFASGYGRAIGEGVDFPCNILCKPYTLEQLQTILKSLD
jgi:PAS domain S-box-containing protein